MLLVMIPSEALWKVCIIPPSEITIWVNQLQVLDKTSTLSPLLKSRHSTINSMSGKTSSWQLQEKLMQINSIKQSASILAQLNHQYKVKLPINNNLTSHHPLCSAETTKFQIPVSVSDLLHLAGMILTFSQCTTSPDSLDNTELINTQEPT